MPFSGPTRFKIGRLILAITTSSPERAFVSKACRRPVPLRYWMPANALPHFRADFRRRILDYDNAVAKHKGRGSQPRFEPALAEIAAMAGGTGYFSARFVRASA